MAVELFAGISVSDCAAALSWYEKLFGSPPSFFPNEREAVWDVGAHRWIYIELRAEHAGHALNTLLVDGLDTRVAAIGERGLEPAGRQTYSNGVRKITYVDPDGNEIGFGGGPTPTSDGPDGQTRNGACPSGTLGRQASRAAERADTSSPTDALPATSILGTCTELTTPPIAGAPIPVMAACAICANAAPTSPTPRSIRPDRTSNVSAFALTVLLIDIDLSLAGRSMPPGHGRITNTEANSNVAHQQFDWSNFASTYVSAEFYR
ncbi:VOC family protein [Amycolatopsis antarctica]|uniref:VOC family protein n=1 Tax=Amycolatopsis antarctica TaxID=1854586 RepID=UPI001F0AF459|nr:VOC family protein [Amycolatopsis antarctica]